MQSSSSPLPESSLHSQHTFFFLKSPERERERESKKERDKKGYERKEGKGVEYGIYIEGL